MKTPRILLASSSPRRLDLMTQVQLKVDVMSPQADETPIPGEGPAEMVKRLCIAKALSVALLAQRSHPRGLIIAADTTVVSPNGKLILGKPTSSLEAQGMLRMLSGKTHSVFTGYCILSLDKTRKKKRVVRVIESRVKMRSLTQKTIRSYIASGEPMDKAGSYGAQGLGTALIEQITGSYTNVVGLPMTQILKDLEAHFDVLPFSWLKPNS
jgi:septum formation protein